MYAKLDSIVRKGIKMDGLMINYPESKECYTIIVADDEEELRRALIEKVDWESVGFQVIGEAENGVEALELVEKLKPDLLLTDIKMPFVSGIELARQVREVHPSTQIAFLSGYDDFSYAQKAIQYNIISYMLKPISAIELTEELKKIKEKIDEQFRMFATEKHEPRRDSGASFFMSLLLDEFQSEDDAERNRDLLEKVVELGIVQDVSSVPVYTVITTSIFNKEEENETREANIVAINSVLEKYFKTVSFYINGRITSILFSTKRGIEKYLHIAVEEILEKVKRILGKNAILGVGRMESDLSNTHKIYVESVKAIGYATKKKKGIYFITDMEQYKNSAELISEKALEIIDSHYMDQDISLVSVSKEIAVSPNYLSALIKKSTGCTFIDLLSQKRIKVATELLLHSNCKIREIAEQCGYSDQHYFSYCFKKITGVSPNSYRRGESEDNKLNER